jgi:hypothetical protein
MELGGHCSWWPLHWAAVPRRRQFLPAAARQVHQNFRRWWDTAAQKKTLTFLADSTF